jgi:trans-aconitate methyltransferase
MKRYKWNAQDYEKHSQAQQKWARELIESLSLRGIEDVLDLGCGDGKVTAEISKLVSKGAVIGVDNSQSMIELASERYPLTQYTNLSFQEMDARNLNFDECFNLIFSNAALHWVKEQKPVIEGMYKGLKQGGKILLQMGGKGTIRNSIRVRMAFIFYEF